MISEFKLDGLFVSLLLSKEDAEEIANKLLRDKKESKREVEIHPFDNDVGRNIETEAETVMLHFKDRASAHAFANKLLQEVKAKHESEAISICIGPAALREKMASALDEESEHCLFLLY
jgi:hypothetical protein